MKYMISYRTLLHERSIMLQDQAIIACVLKRLNDERLQYETVPRLKMLNIKLIGGNENE